MSSCSDLFRAKRGRRGSVLIIVMITLVFAAMALVVFMDKAMNDLLVDHRDAVNQRLRMEAYSALETTLAVLEDFRDANSGLRSSSEGWTDPLGFAGYTPAEGRTVEVTFEDESGKIPLPAANAEVLKKLFEFWQVPTPDAEIYADALLGWMKKDHVYSTAIMPDYDQSAIAYQPPLRPMRSYSELAAIDKVREFFYDADGQPNENWRRFVASVSLLNYAKPNLNGARPETLAAIGQYDETQRKALGDYLSGSGTYAPNGANSFKDTAQAATVAGQGGASSAFTTTISALRILITVHEGKSQFRLSTVVTHGRDARVVQETATSQRAQTSATSSQTKPTAPNAAQTNNPSTTNAQNSATANLRYPFTLLEIRENDEIPPAPTPAVENPM